MYMVNASISTYQNIYVEYNEYETFYYTIKLNHKQRTYTLHTLHCVYMSHKYRIFHSIN